MTSRIFATALLLCTFLPGLLLYGQPGHSDAISEQPNIDCSPAPCILPEIGTGALSGLSFFANPSNAQQLMFSILNPGGFASGSSAVHSSDGGSTWVQTPLPDYGDGGANGGSFVAYNLNNLAYAVWTEIPYVHEYSSVGFSTSGDNGSTWSAAKQVVTAGIHSQPTAESVTVDNTARSRYPNTIYISIHQSGISTFTAYVAVASSHDGGVNWSTATVDRPNPGEAWGTASRLAISKHGTVYLVWTRPQTDSPCASAQILVSKSADGGFFWGRPVVVTRVMQPPNCILPNTNVGLGLHPVIAVDTSDGPFGGHIYVSMYNWTGTQLQVLVAHSTNGGATWSVPVPVAPVTETHDQFAPSISVSPSGILGVTWLDRRDDPANIQYRAHAAVSADDGNVFGTNFGIASALTDPNTGYPEDTRNLWMDTRLLGLFPDAALSGSLQLVLGGIRLIH
jgi:hypothetical protein